MKKTLPVVVLLFVLIGCEELNLAVDVPSRVEKKIRK